MQKQRHGDRNEGVLSDVQDHAHRQQAEQWVAFTGRRAVVSCAPRFTALHERNSQLHAILA